MKMRLVATVLLTLLLAAACGKKKDDPGNLAGLFPDELFVGRTGEVVIAGDGLRFKEDAVVDFGADVTVNEVEVLGPSTIVVYVTIAPTAADGLRDVTVDGNVLTEALTLVPPMTSTLLGGTGQQGGLNLYELVMVDPTTPFTENGVPTLTGPGEIFDYFVIDATTANVGIYLDAVAAPAPLSLSIADGATSVINDLVTATAVTPEAIDTGAGWNPDLTGIGTVALGTLDLAAGEVADINVDAGDSTLLFVMDTTDGSIGGAKLIQFVDPGSSLSLGADKNATYLLALHDAQLFGAGAAGQVTGTFTVDTLNVATETEPNDTSATATALSTLPALIATGFDVTSDIDFFEIDLAGTTTNNAAIVKVLTMPAVDSGLADNDTYVTLYEDIDSIVENDDLVGLFAGATAGLIGASAYIELSNSPFVSDDTGNFLAAVRAYDADISTMDTGNNAIGSPAALGADPGTMGSIVAASIGTATQEDYYQFTLAADAHVVIETGPAGAGTLPMADTNLVLYDNADTEIASNEDISVSFFGGNFFSRIEMDLVAGTYKVLAQSSPTFAPDDTGDYRLMVFVP